jgi:PadR family transcriptional regulator PadR
MEPGEAKSPLTQLRRGVIEFCVLSLLEQESMYAVDLVKRLAEIDALATTEGTIYPLLSRLRRDRAVTTEWRESTSGPPRRYYSITPGGTKAINAFRGEWASFVDGVEQFLRIGGHHAG